MNGLKKPFTEVLKAVAGLSGVAPSASLRKALLTVLLSRVSPCSWAKAP